MITRKTLFGLLTLSFPLLVIVLLEAGLRVADYGGNLDLVVRKNVRGRDFYGINRAVAQRYFPASGVSIPEPRDQMFQIRKGPRTRRIFCLGESTMAGFPYDFHATAPSFLCDRLRQLLPDDTIEVINVGLSAVGSYVVLDFMKELLDFEPDLFIVYVGHNEFYGVYGVGSSFAGASAPWMTRLTLALLHTKTFLLVRNAYASLTSPPVPSAGQDATLMGQVVGQGSIPYGSAQYFDAHSIYRENLERLIDAAASRGVPIIFTSLVSNVRTQAPFQTAFADGTPADVRARHSALIAVADSLLGEGEPARALDLSNRAVLLDSTHAGGWFVKGRAAYALGRFGDAAVALKRAKDLDMLRFRATEDFQKLLLAVCIEHGVPVVRADSAFEAASPHGIVGPELIMEHLHPNIRGYFLMGKVMAGAIRNTGLWSSSASWHMDRDLTDQEYFERSTVSDFDSLCGAIRIGILTQRWPFPSTGPAPSPFVPANPEAAIASAYVQGSRAWSLARYDLASEYGRRGRFELARRECLAVAKAAPYSYEPLLRVADYYRMEGNAAGAEEYYRRSFRTESNPFAPMKLAIIFLEQERNREATEQILATLDAERQTGPRLDAHATSTARYLLAVALAKGGQFDAAREHIRIALQINPGNTDARDLRKQIDAFERETAR